MNRNEAMKRVENLQGFLLGVRDGESLSQSVKEVGKVDVESTKGWLKFLDKLYKIEMTEILNQECNKESKNFIHKQYFDRIEEVFITKMRSLWNGELGEECIEAMVKVNEMYFGDSKEDYKRNLMMGIVGDFEIGDDD